MKSVSWKCLFLWQKKKPTSTSLVFGNMRFDTLSNNDTIINKCIVDNLPTYWLISRNVCQWIACHLTECSNIDSIYSLHFDTISVQLCICAHSILVYRAACRRALSLVPPRFLDISCTYAFQWCAISLPLPNVPFAFENVIKHSS